VAFVRHLTLTANVVSTVTLTAADNFSTFEVLNRNGLGEVYISHDGTANPTNPTVGGNDFDVVVAAIGAALQLRRIGTGTATIDLISPANVDVTVRGIA
jgi:hypothetical protein